MKIVSVEHRLERVFWDLVNKDPLDYYFFIFDWTRRKEQTKVLLAMKDNRVAGAMLLYSSQGRDNVVQLRGSQEAVELLLKSIDFERVELQAPPDCEDVVLRKYRPWFKHVLVLMSLKKGEENLLVKHVPLKLDIEDISEVADLMRRTDPEVWADLDVERQKVAWKDAYILGIRQDDRLVSVGLTRFADIGSNVGAIATDQAYRNMGFATSVVSALVKEILRKSPPALIHAFSDNAPAMRVYTKVGFRPYKQYLLIRAERAKG